MGMLSHRLALLTSPLWTLCMLGCGTDPADSSPGVVPDASSITPDGGDAAPGADASDTGTADASDTGTADASDTGTADASDTGTADASDTGTDAGGCPVGSAYFAESFENGIDYNSKWTDWQDQQISSTVVTTKPNPSGNGEVGYFFTGDPENGIRPRAEIYKDAFLEKEGGDYWYQWRMYLDPQADSDDENTILGQWHNYDDPGTGDDASFAVAFRLDWTDMRVWIASGDRNFVNSSWNWTGVGLLKDASNPVVLARGAWHTMKLHIKWSTGDDGYVEGWVDGQPLLQGDNNDGRVYGNTMANSLGAYFKIGVYRLDTSGWGSTGVYYDDLLFCAAP